MNDSRNLKRGLKVIIHVVNAIKPVITKPQKRVKSSANFM